EYRGDGDSNCGDTGNWLTMKENTLKTLGGVGDNNSWGYTVGWSAEGTAGWTWTGDDELLGGYDGILSAAIDHAAIRNPTLMMQAAGNEAQNSGPTQEPFVHNHADPNTGNPTTQIWCYSKDGSGTDCPLVSCPGGNAFCETEKHPSRSPYGSVNWNASEKNVVSVGAVDFTQTIASFSSRGPAKDGRVKPELVAKGRSLFSTFPNNGYSTLQGTSMATPVVTGTMAILTEQWRKTTSNPTGRPSPVMLKALAIAGADDIGIPGPDYTYGFGLLDAKKSVDLIIADGGTGKRIKADNAAQGAIFDYPLTLTSTQDLRIVLSWFDPEALPVGTEDVTEPTDTTPYVLTLNVPVSPRICSATDVDLFTFKSNKVGTVTVTIAATDAPLTVSLIGGGGSTSKTIAANTTNTVTLPVSTATPTSFTVNVTASAPPANGSGYTISANFPFSAPNRRRGTTHDYDGGDPSHHDDVQNPARRRN